MTKLTLAALVLIASSASIAQTGSATDAQRSPVVSAPATAPSGTNEMVTVPAGATVTVTPTQATVSTPTTATGAPPPCSKSVTDRCIQTNEGRGGKMRGGKHRKRHRTR